MKSPYKTLLKHPLSEAFLHLKWKQIKYIHLILIIITHFIYSTVYTVYALLVFGTICEPDTNTTIGGVVLDWADTSTITHIRRIELDTNLHEVQSLKFYYHRAPTRVFFLVKPFASHLRIYEYMHYAKGVNPQ